MPKIRQYGDGLLIQGKASDDDIMELAMLSIHAHLSRIDAGLQPCYVSDCPHRAVGVVSIVYIRSGLNIYHITEIDEEKFIRENTDVHETIVNISLCEEHTVKFFRDEDFRSMVVNELKDKVRVMLWRSQED